MHENIDIKIQLKKNFELAPSYSTSGSRNNGPAFTPPFWPLVEELFLRLPMSGPSQIDIPLTGGTGEFLVFEFAPNIRYWWLDSLLDIYVLMKCERHARHIGMKNVIHL